jgi:Fe2+ or Zn2+ uptake regulation protein
MRLTDQRRLILAVVQATDTHPTAERVHAAVRRRIPRVSLGTVYRNLRLLARHGLLAEIAGGPTLRFDARVERHHHFTCSTCGHIFDLDDRVAARTGFRVSHHRIEFYGQCDRCAATKTRPTPRGGSSWPSRSRAPRVTST